MKQISNRKAIRILRREHPEWAQFTEENLLRRYYEAKKHKREVDEAYETLKKYMEELNETNRS